MRKVFSSHSQCAHVWAQQTQAEGSGSRMFFRGKTIYSYGTHFPIAEFRRPDVVMFNSAGYSVSTSKHQGHVRSALHGLPVHVFTVPAELFSAPPREVLSYLVEQHTVRLETAARAKVHADWRLREAEEAKETAIKWAQLFKLKQPKFAKFDRDALLARIAENKKKHALKIKRAEAKRAKEEAKALTKYREDIAAWREGGPLPYYDSRYKEPTVLRVSGDVVQTSRGAEVPVKDAIRAIKFIAGVMDSGKDWHRNGEQFHVGAFQLDSVDTRGNIHAGCHYIEWPEILHLAGLLDVLGESKAA